MCLAGVWGLRNIVPGLLEVCRHYDARTECGADSIVGTDT